MMQKSFIHIICHIFITCKNKQYKHFFLWWLFPQILIITNYFHLTLRCKPFFLLILFILALAFGLCLHSIIGCSITSSCWIFIILLIMSWSWFMETSKSFLMNAGFIMGIGCWIDMYLKLGVNQRLVFPRLLTRFKEPLNIARFKLINKTLDLRIGIYEAKIFHLFLNCLQ